MDTNGQPLRRSKRLQNKYNAGGGALSGDKYRLFTYNFNLSQKQRSNHNEDTGRSTCPIVSRCKRKLKFVHHAPNVFVIDNFLTDNEINHLLGIVSNNMSKFESSYTQATGKDQIYSKERTSTFIFLQKYMDKISRTIERRAADIVSISIENVEPLQLLRYTEGQEFTLHHDAGTLINETRPKNNSSSSLWSVASNHSNRSLDSAYSCDFIHNTQMFDHSNRMMQPNSTFPAQVQSNQLSHPNPTSAQYAKRYQQWQQTVQQQRIAQPRIAQESIPSRPQSCPPVFMHQRMDEDEKLNKQDMEEKYDEHTVQMVAPVRLFSFFVYLATLPEGCGGETYFPKLSLKVRPERGKAVLWCNVDPRNIAKADPMLIHRACPVKGKHIKIGMNIWIDNTKVDANYQ